MPTYSLITIRFNRPAHFLLVNTHPSFLLSVTSMVSPLLFCFVLPAISLSWFLRNSLNTLRVEHLVQLLYNLPTSHNQLDDHAFCFLVQKVWQGIEKNIGKSKASRPLPETTFIYGNLLINHFLRTSCSIRL